MVSPQPQPQVRGMPTPGRCLVMGVLNVTPDSFSDGGDHYEPDAACRHGLAEVAAGADLVDVGGESTRPGAIRIDEAEERRRVLPAVQALTDAGALVSIDTTRSGVASAAIESGARMVNDVSGGQADPELLRVAAEAGVAYVVMHWRGHSERMQQLAVYDDVVGEVCAELRQQLEKVAAAGIEPDQIVLDPGLGFAKTAEHNWELLQRLDALAALGPPVLVGASRKAFLGRLLAADDGTPRPAKHRDHATAAVSTLAAAAGAWCVRVHDAAPSADAVRVARRWCSR